MTATLAPFGCFAPDFEVVGTMFHGRITLPQGSALDWIEMVSLDDPNVLLQMGECDQVELGIDTGIEPGSSIIYTDYDGYWTLDWTREALSRDMA